MVEAFHSTSTLHINKLSSIFYELEFVEFQLILVVLLHLLVIVNHNDSNSFSFPQGSSEQLNRQRIHLRAMNSL